MATAHRKTQGDNRRQSLSKEEPEANEDQLADSSLGPKKVTMTLEGIGLGLLFNSKAILASGKDVDRFTPEQRADMAGHWEIINGKRQLVLPWEMLYWSFMAAAKRKKAKGRFSERLHLLIGPAISCTQPFFPLGTEYQVHTMWGRIPPGTGVPKLLYRCLIPKWQVEVELVVDDTYFDLARLREIIAYAGTHVGIGAFRPEKLGQYGKFKVSDFRVEE